MRFISCAAALLLLACGTTAAADRLDALGTVAAFDQALASGDVAKAKALLAPDVLVYEGGAEETSLAEYARHHLGADMEFLKGVQRTVLSRRNGTSGDLAWVATRSRLTGTFRDKEYDLYGTETMVLRREQGQWRIAHIQWSSQRVPAPPAP